MNPHTVPLSRRSRAPWAWLIVLGLLLVAALALYIGIMEFDAMPLNIVIDGEDLHLGVNLATLPLEHKLAVAGGLLLALLVVAVVLPLTLLLVAGAVLLITLLAVGLPLFALLLALAFVGSPLLLLGLLLWLLLRGRRSRSATISA